jgi:hypothetical protein
VGTRGHHDVTWHDRGDGQQTPRSTAATGEETRPPARRASRPRPAHDPLTMRPPRLTSDDGTRVSRTAAAPRPQGSYRGDTGDPGRLAGDRPSPDRSGIKKRALSGHT